MVPLNKFNQAFISTLAVICFSKVIFPLNSMHKFAKLFWVAGAVNHITVFHFYIYNRNFPT